VSLNLTDAREIEEAFSWLNKYWNKSIQPIFYDAKSIEGAFSLLDDYRGEAKIIAGGIDLLGLMKNKIISPKILVNIKNIPHLDYISETSDILEIGALTLIRDIGRSSLISSQYPLLSQAAQSVGSPQIRNMATMGGNLCQEVRCWYYRRSPITGISYNCRRKREGGVCYAIDGENENHAIIGEGECFAVCPSDMATALLSLDAKIKTVNPNGGRVIPIARFYTNLGNILESNEIITGIQIPKIKRHLGQRYIKFRTRKAIDFSIVSVAVVMTIDSKFASTVKIALGGVSSIPYEAAKAEEVLKGELLTDAVVEKAAEASINDSMPLNKNGYKVPIVKALVRRALLELKGSIELKGAPRDGCHTTKR
jgi:xanthine dehydrogenase YagS FAD-binding subunit